MSRFRYAFAPLCFAAITAYFVGRLALRNLGGFWHDHFTDLWLIPAALPPVLWVQRRLGLRSHDRKPTWAELGLHFAVWSIAAEWVAPRWFAHAVGDWRDVAAYACGAVLAGLWWQRRGRA